MKVKNKEEMYKKISELVRKVTTYQLKKKEVLKLNSRNSPFSKFKESNRKGRDSNLSIRTIF